MSQFMRSVDSYNKGLNLQDLGSKTRCYRLLAQRSLLQKSTGNERWQGGVLFPPLAEIVEESLGLGLQYDYNLRGGDPKFASLLRTPWFEPLALAGIVCNALWILAESTLVEHVSLEETPTAFLVGEFACLLFFGIEYLCRLMAAKSKSQFFLNRWMLLDAAVLLCAVASSASFVGCLFVKSAATAAWLRSIAKLLRVLRLCRLLHLLWWVPTIALLCGTLYAALFPVCCILGAAAWFILGVAIFFTQMLSETELGHKRFGSLLQSLETLVVSGLCLDNVSGLIDELREENAVLIVVLMLHVFFSLGVCGSLFVAVICKAFSGVADAQTSLTQRRRVADSVGRYFAELGRSDHPDSSVTQEELRFLLASEEVEWHLLQHDISRSQAEEIVHSIYELPGLDRLGGLPLWRCLQLVLECTESQPLSLGDFLRQQRVFSGMKKDLSAQIHTLEEEVLEVEAEVKAAAAKVEQEVSSLQQITPLAPHPQPFPAEERLGIEDLRRCLRETDASKEDLRALLMKQHEELVTGLRNLQKPTVVVSAPVSGPPLEGCIYAGAQVGMSGEHFVGKQEAAVVWSQQSGFATGSQWQHQQMLHPQDTALKKVSDASTLSSIHADASPSRREASSAEVDITWSQMVKTSTVPQLSGKMLSAHATGQETTCKAILEALQEPEPPDIASCSDREHVRPMRSTQSCYSCRSSFAEVESLPSTPRGLHVGARCRIIGVKGRHTKLNSQEGIVASMDEPKGWLKIKMDDGSKKRIKATKVQVIANSIGFFEAFAGELARRKTTGVTEDASSVAADDPGTPAALADKAAATNATSLDSHWQRSPEGTLHAQHPVESTDTADAAGGPPEASSSRSYGSEVPLLHAELRWPPVDVHIIAASKVMPQHTADHDEEPALQASVSSSHGVFIPVADSEPERADDASLQVTALERTLLPEEMKKAAAAPTNSEAQDGEDGKPELPRYARVEVVESPQRQEAEMHTKSKELPSHERRAYLDEPDDHSQEGCKPPAASSAADQQQQRLRLPAVPAVSGEDVPRAAALPPPLPAARAELAKDTVEASTSVDPKAFSARQSHGPPDTAVRSEVQTAPADQTPPSTAAASTLQRLLVADPQLAEDFHVLATLAREHLLQQQRQQTPPAVPPDYCADGSGGPSCSSPTEVRQPHSGLLDALIAGRIASPRSSSNFVPRANDEPIQASSPRILQGSEGMTVTAQQEACCSKTSTKATCTEAVPCCSKGVATDTTATKTQAIGTEALPCCSKGIGTEEVLMVSKETCTDDVVQLKTTASQTETETSDVLIPSECQHLRRRGETHAARVVHATSQSAACSVHGKPPNASERDLADLRGEASSSAQASSSRTAAEHERHGRADAAGRATGDHEETLRELETAGRQSRRGSEEGSSLKDLSSEPVSPLLPGVSRKTSGARSMEVDLSLLADLPQAHLSFSSTPFSLTLGMELTPPPPWHEEPEPMAELCYTASVLSPSSVLPTPQTLVEITPKPDALLGSGAASSSRLRWPRLPTALEALAEPGVLLSTTPLPSQGSPLADHEEQEQRDQQPPLFLQTAPSLSFQMESVEAVSFTLPADTQEEITLQPSRATPSNETVCFDGTMDQGPAPTVPPDGAPHQDGVPPTDIVVAATLTLPSDWSEDIALDEEKEHEAASTADEQQRGASGPFGDQAKEAAQEAVATPSVRGQRLSPRPKGGQRSRRVSEASATSAAGSVRRASTMVGALKSLQRRGNSKKTGLASSDQDRTPSPTSPSAGTWPREHRGLIPRRDTTDLHGTGQQALTPRRSLRASTGEELDEAGYMQAAMSSRRSSRRGSFRGDADTPDGSPSSTQAMMRSKTISRQAGPSAITESTALSLPAAMRRTQTSPAGSGKRSASRRAAGERSPDLPSYMHSTRSSRRGSRRSTMQPEEADTDLQGYMQQQLRTLERSRPGSSGSGGDNDDADSPVERVVQLEQSTKQGSRRNSSRTAAAVPPEITRSTKTMASSSTNVRELPGTSAALQKPVSQAGSRRSSAARSQGRSGGSLLAATAPVGAFGSGQERRSSGSSDDKRFSATTPAPERVLNIEARRSDGASSDSEGGVVQQQTQPRPTDAAKKTLVLSASSDSGEEAEQPAEQRPPSKGVGKISPKRVAAPKGKAVRSRVASGKARGAG
eukprot:TRINITY_DN51428_c0_g1_i2.p1 TRINITY_DN51428_c0_g1~~TRINITY_DN51428_c0_g1_i2.p1  ORF type:complete len:2159 (-),score=469.71 TRINITY_DN51428_c0_g1_i2:85-6561(-)